LATYQDFLTALIAIGNKIPQLVPILLAIIDQVQQAIAIIQGHPAHAFGAGEFSPSADEAALEGQLVAAAGEHPKGTFGAIGDGTLIEVIRQVWLFIKDNPELMQLILTLLKIKPA